MKPFGLVAALGIDIDVQEDAEELFLRIFNGIEDSFISGESNPVDLIKF